MNSRLIENAIAVLQIEGDHAQIAAIRRMASPDLDREMLRQELDQAAAQVAELKAEIAELRAALAARP